MKSTARKKEQSQEAPRKGEDAAARKGSEVAKHCVFTGFGGAGGAKRRLANAAGGEPARQMKDKK